MKLAILKISPHIFVEVCKYGFNEVRIVRDAIPEDAKYIRSFVDDNSGWGKIGIVLESESFEDVKDGGLIPILPDPAFERKEGE